MNVSRETSLTDLFEKLSGALNINEHTIGDGFSFSCLVRPFLALFILSLKEVYKKNLLFVFEDNVEAELIYSDCLALRPDNVFYFPESTAGDIDVKGFNLENERYRSEVANAIRENLSGAILSSVSAANEFSIDKVKEPESGIVIKPGTEINHKEVVSALRRWRYEPVDRVETPKTFSVRGGILDVLLPYSAHPIRIEFFGNEIESVRIFNPQSQRTIKYIDQIDILPPPILNDYPQTKQSLLDIYQYNPIFVYRDNEHYSIRTSDSLSPIDLKCEPIFKNGKLDNDFLSHALNKAKPDSVFLFTENNKSSKIVTKYGLEGCSFVKSNISNCFYSFYVNVLGLSSLELSGIKTVNQSRWSIESVSDIPQKEFSSIYDVDWGDRLVHQDFGIGLYRGLEVIKTRDGVAQDFIKIEYADQSNVYVPVEKFNRVHKMVMTGSRDPELSNLNGTKWIRQKQVAKNAAQEAVQDLINLYSSRNKKRGFNYSGGSAFMSELQASFPYDETPGQITAINDVVSDMEKEYPVDRLICGDVGFGKTEVALRAALKSIVSGKKVLFLTPTTILADQHYISTKARFEPLAVKLELLSRFKTKKEQGQILEKMLTGSVDMVIGTHRLLSQDVNFPDLGLLIIDEEHRFGVKHKEKLRQLRASLDVVTLSATPIPRTLQQSLLGVRDISRISTPPKTRRPIKTFIQYLDWGNISKVIDLELMRGGQVYFLHNDIASIPFILKKLNQRFPEKIVGVAHGKLNSRDLEKTVLTFFDGNIDILLCTTIIESGLDVANANTILINNAQNFGLSQLYQIRGRVGRGNKQAYCHLLLPKGKIIGEDARKRLKAIEQYTTLGSGYDISIKDLEIRGAGNLFGYKQSGHMAKVGFEMYCKLLQEAVDETLGNPTEKQPPKISIPIDALLDKEYVPLVQDRLYFYQQLSEARTTESVDEIEEELADRFGKLPDSSKNLLLITKIRINLTGSSVSSLSVIGSDIVIKLSDFKPFNSAENLIKELSSKLAYNDLVYNFKSVKDGFKITVECSNLEKAISSINLFVELFSN